VTHSGVDALTHGAVRVLYVCLKLVTRSCISYEEVTDTGFSTHNKEETVVDILPQKVTFP